MHRHYLLLFLLLVELAFAQKKHPAIKIEDATVRNWISGAPGGRTGTTWSIKVLVNTARPVEFKNLWLGKENVPFDIQFYSNKCKQNIVEGDSVLLVYVRINKQKNENGSAKRVPIDYHGAALIECIIEKQARYITVDKFRELEIIKGE